jgi:hypothetical protein
MVMEERKEKKNEETRARQVGTTTSKILPASVMHAPSQPLIVGAAEVLAEFFADVGF